jgi:peptide deformylase
MFETLLESGGVGLAAPQVFEIAASFCRHRDAGKEDEPRGLRRSSIPCSHR